MTGFGQPGQTKDWVFSVAGLHRIAATFDYCQCLLSG